jgi:hypothetical protein
MEYMTLNPTLRGMFLAEEAPEVNNHRENEH